MTTIVIEKKEKEIVGYADKMATIGFINHGLEDVTKLFKGNNYVVALAGSAGVLLSLEAWVDTHPIVPNDKASLAVYLNSLQKYLQETGGKQHFHIVLGCELGIFKLNSSNVVSEINTVVSIGSGSVVFNSVYSHSLNQNKVKPDVEELFKQVIKNDLNSSEGYDKEVIKFTKKIKALKPKEVTEKVMSNNKFHELLLGKPENPKKANEKS